MYDPYNGTTYPVDPVDSPSLTAYTLSTISYLSENGIAVGEYQTGSASGTFHAFIFNTADGAFADLSGDVANGLPASSYQNLIDAYYTDAPGGTLYASATNTGAANGTISALVTLTGVAPVPEPASLSLICLGAAGLIGRRRKTSAAG